MLTGSLAIEDMYQRKITALLLGYLPWKLDINLVGSVSRAMVVETARSALVGTMEVLPALARRDLYTACG